MEEHRPKIIIMAVLLAVLAGIFYFSMRIENEPGQMLEVAFLNVGKGDSIVIMAEGYTAMIDTGYSETADHVCEFLDQRQIESIDDLVITHFDKDHAGGVSRLLSDYEIKRVIAPDYEGAKKTYDAYEEAVEDWGGYELRLKEEMEIELERAGLEIYPSGQRYDPKEKNDNDMSLIIKMKNGRDSFLFMGDAEKPEIEEYLRNHGDSADVLKIPHHGEIEDNTDRLLNVVSPEIAVITDGVNDPADEELTELLESREIEYKIPRVDGDVIISSDGEGEIKTSCLK